MAPNKTLAAQLANEFRELLPNNAVEYFVSYYDYYQPEAYVPQTDTYIEKDSSINDEVERLRHSATNSLLTRRDVVVVATVSCIYGLGTPQEYVDRMVAAARSASRSSATSCCASSSTSSTPATTWPSPAARSGCAATPSRSSRSTRSSRCASRCSATRSSGSTTLHPLTGEIVARGRGDRTSSRPPTTSPGRSGWSGRSVGIEAELGDRLAELERQGKLLEAQRLRMRTTYDIEMMRQVGSCSGIENYSRHIDGREPRDGAELPARLLPRGLPAGHRRVARHRAADRRHVRGRHVAQAHPGRPRVPAAERHGQPAAALGGVPRAHRPDRLPVGDPGPTTSWPRATAWSSRSSARPG